jgi:TPR repeat protein
MNPRATVATLRLQCEPSGSPKALPNFSPKQLRKRLALLPVLTAIFLALGFVSRARTNSHLGWTFCGVAAFLLCWQFILFFAAKRKGIGLSLEFTPVRSHYVQACVQIPIYIYWGLYWPLVYPQIPLILSQIVFLYIFDALVAWSRGQTWRTGFGPWPIILSSNLFIWFKDDVFLFQFLLVATGVLGKQFIRWRRDGKWTHIFNPSAFALTLFSLVLIFSGTTGYTWGEQIAFTLARPPHIYKEVFLCGLIVQFFFSVTLLTFSAAVTIGLLSLAYTQFTGVYLFFYTNIPIAIFLGFHLLMTDPATSPRSSIGRVIFGSLYGGSAFVAFIFLKARGIPEFYDKLLVVPILNLLTPLLDRLATRGVAGQFSRWELSVGLRKMNLAFMGCWIAVFGFMLATKFIEAPHPGATIGFWIRAAEEKRPHASENLQFLLDEFTRVDLADRSQIWATSGIASETNRQQALGDLCNLVAGIYAEGKIVPASPAKAIRNYARACELGNSDACADIAIQYLMSGRDEAQAEATHALSVLENNHVVFSNGIACFLLGYSYETGRGNVEDKVKARRFLEGAAALGNVEACKHLARMQLTGEGGTHDHSAAAGWLQKAADAQDGPSCLILAKLYHNGDGVARDAQREIAMLKKACDLGVQSACKLLQSGQR